MIYDTCGKIEWTPPKKTKIPTTFPVQGIGLNGHQQVGH